MKQFLTLFLILIFLSPLACQGEEYPPMPTDPDEKIEWMKSILGEFEVIDRQPQDIMIYGRVIDQNNDPVPGAELEVSWAYNTALLEKKIKEQIVTTDAEGNFSFEAPDHVDPLIRKVQKKGYEFNKKSNLYFSLSLEARNAVLFNSQNNPVILYLRKLGETIYLYHDDRLQWYSDLPSETVSYTILKRGLKAIDSDISLLKTPEQVDLIFHVEHNLTNNQYTFKIVSPLASNGMFLSDNKLYIAPADGYSPEITITLNHGEKNEKYLYFKSRNLEYETETGKEYKPIYSRMKMTFNADPETLYFYYDTWTNPYGSPNLEYEPNMPADLHVHLSDQAEEAIQSGKLPPEPNLQEMMASGQYN